jgi:hypothetical protein
MFVVTWAAIVVLFLGLAAVLREVRLLRGAGAGDGFADAGADLALGGSFSGAADSEGTRLVLAADSGCALCVAVARRLGGLAAHDARPAPVLLTHEPAQLWDGAAGGLRVVSDPEAWRAVSHLQPPVVMLVDGAGTVRRLSLPAREEDVDDVWRDLLADK